MRLHAHRRTALLSRSQLVERFHGRHVAVVGDLIADEFVTGHVRRVSREAPVLILGHDSTTLTAGGAGNAAVNVAALSGDATLVGIVGDDEIGSRLTDVFPGGVDASRVERVAGYQTPLKTRILAGGPHSARQQIVRVDRESPCVFTRETRDAFEQSAVEAALQADAVVVSDYGSGLVTPGTVACLRNALGRARHRDRDTVPILVDSRYGLLGFTWATLVTPNESELEAALDVQIGDDLNALEQVGRRVLQQLRVEAVLVTRGSRGMALFERGRPTTHVPVVGTDEVSDVTGAGDTVIATAALALGSGGSYPDAACLANHAAGLVVMKRGTATVDIRELHDAVVATDPALAATA